MSTSQKKITRNDDDVNVKRDGAFYNDKYSFKQLTTSSIGRVLYNIYTVNTHG